MFGIYPVVNSNEKKSTTKNLRSNQGLKFVLCQLARSQIYSEDCYRNAQKKCYKNLPGGIYMLKVNNRNTKTRFYVVNFELAGKCRLGFRRKSGLEQQNNPNIVQYVGTGKKFCATATQDFFYLYSFSDIKRPTNITFILNSS